MQSALNGIKIPVLCHRSTGEGCTIIPGDFGKEVLHDRAKSADIVAECSRPGVTKHLEPGFDTFKKINPQTVFCSLSGYDREGPFISHPGHSPFKLWIYTVRQ